MIILIVPGCSPNPCQNGGSCSVNADDVVGLPNCLCPPNYRGIFCEAEVSGKLCKYDIVENVCVCFF